MKTTCVGQLRVFCGIAAAIVISTAALATNVPRPALLASPSAVALDENGVGFYELPPGLRPANRIAQSRFAGARASFSLRRHGRQQEIVAYSTQIQHIVVINMENRTPENLFGAYWNTRNPATGNTFGNDLDVVDPQSVPFMHPFGLEAAFDPNHAHDPGFVNDAKGKWDKIAPQCSKTSTCPPNTSNLAYVPTPAPGSLATPEASNYVALIEQWAYSNHMLQSNEGPSFPAHQYSIAAQSGGLPGSSIAPNGLIENPLPAQVAPLDADPEDVVVGGGSCATVGSNNVRTTNMLTPYPGNENVPGQPVLPPCNEYKTIFDLMTESSPTQPHYDSWQFIAKDTHIIWAGPMAVLHHYKEYQGGVPAQAQQPFAVDPDAQNFVANLTPGQHPNPIRPFAELTYITPCPNDSDHPNFFGSSNGPQWLAYVINAIGESRYWPNTAILVTWDDWGGFYDNYKPAPPAPWPYHPPQNFYNNPNDPNEWGFRVPFMVISPWIIRRGYVSPTLRSQGAILHFAEEIFQLHSTLHGDDDANSHSTISDMFDFGRKTALPFAPLPTTFKPTRSGNCPK